jgi:polar amino acid transport system substrate-binding protein
MKKMTVHKLKRKSVVFIAMLVFVFCVALPIVRAQEVQCPQAECTLEKIKKRGVLKPGVNFARPPDGYVDAQGNNVGFAPDIARALAEKLKVKVEFIQVTNQNRIPLLLNHSVDVIITAANQTRKREEVVDFTIVYLWDAMGLLVRKGESKDPKDYGMPPKVLSAAQGSLNAVKYLEMFPKAKVIYFQEHTDGVMALLNKKVDAYLTSGTIVRSFAKKFPELEMGGEYFFEPQAPMVRENDSKWRKWLNWTFQELWLEGRYQKIYEKNFGVPPNFHLWSEKMLMPGIGEK